VDDRGYQYDDGDDRDANLRPLDLLASACQREDSDGEETGDAAGARC
jgi:hypothetical protein